MVVSLILLLFLIGSVLTVFSVSLFPAVYLFISSFFLQSTALLKIGDFSFSASRVFVSLVCLSFLIIGIKNRKKFSLEELKFKFYYIIPFFIFVLIIPVIFHYFVHGSIPTIFVKKYVVSLWGVITGCLVFSLSFEKLKNNTSRFFYIFFGLITPSALIFLFGYGLDTGYSFHRIRLMPYWLHINLISEEFAYGLVQSFQIPGTDDYDGLEHLFHLDLTALYPFTILVAVAFGKLIKDHIYNAKFSNKYYWSLIAIFFVILIFNYMSLSIFPIALIFTMSIYFLLIKKRDIFLKMFSVTAIFIALFYGYDLYMKTMPMGLHVSDRFKEANEGKYYRDENGLLVFRGMTEEERIAARRNFTRQFLIRLSLKNSWNKHRWKGLGYNDYSLIDHEHDPTKPIYVSKHSHLLDTLSIWGFAMGLSVWFPFLFPFFVFLLTYRKISRDLENEVFFLSFFTGSLWVAGSGNFGVLSAEVAFQSFFCIIYMKYIFERMKLKELPK